MRRSRRLRKEVRIACSAVLAAIPLACAIVYFHGDEPESTEVTARLMGIEGVSTSFAAAEEAARIILPPEAVLPAPARRVRTSVVFPGYVLPEDGSQETAHAGG